MTGKHPDVMGMPMLDGRLRANCHFEIGNCPFSVAKVASHVHQGPFKWPNVLKQNVAFKTKTACKLKKIKRHLVHSLNLLALSPMQSQPTTISDSEHICTQLAHVKSINTASKCTSHRLPHPKHIHSKGQLRFIRQLN